MQIISKRSGQHDTAEPQDDKSALHGLQIELAKLQPDVIKNNLRPSRALWRNTWLGSVAQRGAKPDTPAAKDSR